MDARGLPWGVQWEIARQVSLRNCSWEDISMSALDYFRTKGSAPLESDSDSVPPAPVSVLNARVAPYVEDYLRWNKDTFGSQRPSKEILATVCHFAALPIFHKLILPNCQVTLART